MANDKKDDGASAPTRVREIRPAGKPASGSEPTMPRPMTPQAGTSSAPTMVKGIGGGSVQPAAAPSGHGGFDPVVGWLVIVEGPGRGKAVDIYVGMNSLGRSRGQRIRVDFGDAAISGEGAAFITFEPKRQTFHINHGGKANIVYLNDEAVLTPMPLMNGNTVAIGETKFRFVQLCGPEFSWEDKK
jgi:hypothetical protein